VDVFKLRNNLIDDYKSYVESFINIKDKKIENSIQDDFEQSIFYPESFIRVNLTFEKHAFRI
jgi:hypothetical protein